MVHRTRGTVFGREGLMTHGIRGDWNQCSRALSSGATNLTAGLNCDRTGYILTVRRKHSLQGKEAVTMLWTILAIILALWLIGLVAEIGGGLIHLLLVVALVVFLFQMFTGRRAV